jgi:hypothetical protein
VATAGYEADLSAARIVASPMGASLLDRLLRRSG